MPELTVVVFEGNNPQIDMVEEYNVFGICMARLQANVQ